MSLRPPLGAGHARTVLSAGSIGPEGMPKHVWSVRPRPLPAEAGPLLRKLVEVQDDLGLSDRSFARLLGISNGHWSHIRACTARMGPKTLHCIARAFPALREDVLVYLAD